MPNVGELNKGNQKEGTPIWESLKKEMPILGTKGVAPSKPARDLWVVSFIFLGVPLTWSYQRVTNVQKLRK